MPYGCLITGGLATLCTALAVTAPRRPFVLGVASLLLGLVYNEATSFHSDVTWYR